MITLDALTLWARAQLGRLGEFWRLMTRAERVLAGGLLWFLVAAPAAGLLTGSSAAWGSFSAALVAAWFSVPVLVDAVMARTVLRNTQEALLEANALQPTGAPRVAEVPCSHGVMQRFIYGPDGWEHGGPAPDPRPQEARTP